MKIFHSSLKFGLNDKEQKFDKLLGLLALQRLDLRKLKAKIIKTFLQKQIMLQELLKIRI